MEREYPLKIVASAFLLLGSNDNILMTTFKAEKSDGKDVITLLEGSRIADHLFFACSHGSSLV